MQCSEDMIIKLDKISVIQFNNQITCNPKMLSLIEINMNGHDLLF